jgi:capsule polysaccharide export protein KpsE/RkpR
MDLLWMLEESSSDLLDNENMADSAMSLVGIIEFEVLDLIDDIFTSLQYAGVTNPQIRGLHLQLPDTFTVELVNNEIRRRP